MADSKEDIIIINDDYKAYKKPSSDFYRLDLKVRKSKQTDRGYFVLTDEIVEGKNYRDFIDEQREKNESITQYIHRLLDAEIERVKKQEKGKNAKEK